MGNRPWLGRIALATLLAVVLSSGGSVALAGGDASAGAAPGGAAPAPGGKAGGAAGSEPKVSREQAIDIARQSFTIPADLGDPNVSFNASSGPYGHFQRWTLNWGPKPGEKGTHYNVVVDADRGDVVGFNLNRDDTEHLPPLSLTRDEAQVVADGFVGKVAAVYKDQVRLHQDSLASRYFYPGEPAVYGFSYERLYQGKPVSGQGLGLSVDARTREVVQYNLNWNPDLQFAAADKTLTAEEAAGAWQEQVKVEPVYVQITPPGQDKPEWRLVYRVRNDGLLLDAATGKLVDYQGNPATVVPWSSYTLLPEPPAPYKAPAQPLSRDQALAVAVAAVGRQLPDPTNVNYNETGGEHPQRSYGFSWNLPDSPQQGWQESINVSVDALRGVVANYSRYEYQPGKPYTQDLKESDLIAVDQARSAALEWMLRVRPDLADQVRMAPPGADQQWCRLPGQAADPQRPLCPNYSVSFQYFHAGIPVSAAASVMVDLKDGTVRNAWAGFEPGHDAAGALPSPDARLSADAATAAYLQAIGLQLTWHLFPAGNGKTPLPPDTPPPPARLVYAAGNPVSMIDARTGHALDYQGRDLTRLSTPPSDIAGHFAQKEIELLLTRGVLTAEDGRFRPEGGVTRGEAVQMLVLARGRRPIYGGRGGGYADLSLAAAPAARAAAPFVEAAVQGGIIEPGEGGADFHPEAPVTREEMALWTVRAMGYGPVAAMQAPIAMTYADAGQIGERYRNAVALLTGLGVLHGGGGSFRPQDALTRGEAAVYLFAVMSQPFQR